MVGLTECSALVAALMLISGTSDGLEVTSPLQHMLLTYANPPIWHRHDVDRVLLTQDTLASIRIRDKTDIVDTVLNCTEKFPWTQLPSDIIILQMKCLNGYNNYELMQQIEAGYVGRYYRLIEYLNITGCNLQNLTARTFRGITMLSSLIIHSRLIKYLPLDVLSHLPNLLMVHMDYCSLTTLSGDLFCRNPKIAFVHVAFNKIRSITSRDLVNGTCFSGTINSLALNGNNIENLVNVNFESFNLNGILSFSNCSIRKVSNATFRGVSNVRTINLSDNYIDSLPDNVFLSLNETLQYINVMNNNLTSINASTLFDGLSLRTIVLHDNRIENISGTFSNLKKLDRLQLENNRLTVVSKSTFYGLSNLDRLSLANNEIETIENGVFDEYENLQIFHIHDNRIRKLPKDIFKFTTSLKEIRMDNNSISNLDDTLFEKCAKLKEVNIRFNQISNLTRLSFTSGRIKYIEMSKNNLSVLPSLTEPYSFSCHNFPSLREVKAYYNYIASINATCFQTLEKLSVSYNEITNIDGFGFMAKLTTLRMRHNRISILPKLEMSKLCNTLVEVDLGQNRIQHIAKGTFSKCKRLEVLKLDRNAIRIFEPIQFPAFRDIRLSHNPFACDCQNENFFYWLNYNTIVAVDDITCAISGETIDVVQIGDCSISDWFKRYAKEIGITLAVLIVLALVASGFVFRFRHEIQVIAFYKWNIRLKCCCKGNPRMNENITYDAFVCFAEEDINYVTDTLIPFLEPKYRLCVYYRDFPLGEDIAEAILDVIHQSAIIIILLSPEFLKSRWGTFEFRKAHHAAITNDDKRMIIILLDDSVLNSNLDLTLRSILYTKAYLKKGDKLFAEKLLHAMPVMPVSAMLKNEDEEQSYM